jgi:hypothetical protein
MEFSTVAMAGGCYQIFRLISVVVWLYLTFTYGTSAFSLPLAHYSSNIRLQHLGYSPLASAFSLLISTTIPDLTILEFIFWTTKLRKQLYKNLKCDT